jgi:hypothetical protein
MSGLELVGIILGAFPLAISGMEHYEETKKVLGTFFKVSRIWRPVRDEGSPMISDTASPPQGPRQTERLPAQIST